MKYLPPCECGQMSCRACNKYQTDPRFKSLWDNGKHILQRRIAPPRADGKWTRLVSFDTSGIGDHLLCLYAITGLAKKYPNDDILYAAPRNVWEWVRPFLPPNVTLIGMTQPVLAHIVYKPYQTYGRSLEEKLDRLGLYCVATGNVSPEQPQHNLLPDWFDGVVLVPYSMWGNREWAVEKWIALEKELNAIGIATLILADRANRPCLEKFNGQKMVGLPPVAVLSKILGSSLVVGCDTGMIHAAGLLAVPALALCSITDKRVLPYPSVQCVQPAFPCVSCFYMGKHFTGACMNACAALESYPVASFLCVIAERWLAVRAEQEQAEEKARQAVFGTVS